MATERRGAEVLPAELVKSAVNAKIEARSEETSHIFISADMPTPVAEAIAESEPQKTEITAEKETEKPAPTQTAQQVKPTTSSFEPHNGDVRVVDGEKQIYILGFGWIKDEGGGNARTTVGNSGDELTGNKAGIRGDTVGSKGGDDAPANSDPAPGTLLHRQGYRIQGNLSCAKRR